MLQSDGKAKSDLTVWRNKLSLIRPFTIDFFRFFHGRTCSSSSVVHWSISRVHDRSPISNGGPIFIQSQSFNTMAERLKKGDASLLGELHATTSGLKVYVSTNGVQDIETARRSMGGHGYSAFSGLGKIYADYLPSVTYVANASFRSMQIS